MSVLSLASLGIGVAAIASVIAYVVVRRMRRDDLVYHCFACHCEMSARQEDIAAVVKIHRTICAGDKP